MQQKRYLENVLHACSDNATGQDAIEWAIITGLVTLTYDVETDVRQIMGPVVGRAVPCPPGSGALGETRPTETNYDRIIVAYQHHLAAEGMAALMQAAVDPTETHVRLAA